ncbi:DUF6979 family protein [Paenibacillus amylolyticus]|uniref:DUF6979 family protein n=1 Tax=Paenibacillus amylolyticus TaxID=1451 RepID=UPI003EBDB434
MEIKNYSIRTIKGYRNNNRAFLNYLCNEFSVVEIKEINTEGTWAQRKGCPKNAFLGLCEEGLVHNIVSGRYTERSGSQKNKNYAVKAVRIWIEKLDLEVNKLGLWKNGYEW